MNHISLEPIGTEFKSWVQRRDNSTVVTKDNDEHRGGEDQVNLATLRDGTEIETADGVLLSEDVFFRTRSSALPSPLRGPSKFPQEACLDAEGNRKPLFETLKSVIATAAFQGGLSKEDDECLDVLSVNLLDDLYSGSGLLYDKERAGEAMPWILTAAKHICDNADKSGSTFDSKWSEIRTTEGEPPAFNYMLSCAATAFIAGISQGGIGGHQTRLASFTRSLRYELNNPTSRHHRVAVRKLLRLIRPAHSAATCKDSALAETADFAFNENQSDVNCYQTLWFIARRSWRTEITHLTYIPPHEWNALRGRLTVKAQK